MTAKVARRVIRSETQAQKTRPTALPILTMPTMRPLPSVTGTALMRVLTSSLAASKTVAVSAIDTTSSDITSLACIGLRSPASGSSPAGTSIPAIRRMAGLTTRPFAKHQAQTRATSRR